MYLHNISEISFGILLFFLNINYFFLSEESCQNHIHSLHNKYIHIIKLICNQCIHTTPNYYLFLQ
jgi:hypothetical protein